jgi:hypothetical protein
MTNSSQPGSECQAIRGGAAALVANIEMEIGDSYAPFVRLAVACFQPGGNGARLSRIVGAEFAQLTPGRTASVAFNPTSTGAKVEIVIFSLRSNGREQMVNGESFGE